MSRTINIRETEGPFTGLHRSVMNNGRPALDWTSFDVSGLDQDAVARAASEWRNALYAEYRSAVYIGQLQNTLLLNDLPLDILTSLGRFVQDELRHAHLAAEVLTALGHPAEIELDVTGQDLGLQHELPLVPQLARWIFGALVVGESVSDYLLRAMMDGTSHPLIHEVFSRFVTDELFHVHFSWYLAECFLEALTPDERQDLDEYLFRHVTQMERSFLESGYFDEAQLTPDDATLGTLSRQQVLKAFHDALSEKIFPRFEQLGLVAHRTWTPAAAAASSSGCRV